MKNKTFLSSLKCAFNGLFTALENEKNFKIYLFNILLTLPLNILFGFSLYEHLIYLVCVVGVFSTECINTAIEKICNLITKDYDENIKIIKDIAAGAVLFWGFAFYISEFVMLGIKIASW